MPSKKLKYGFLNRNVTPSSYPLPVPLAASQYLNKLSGRILTMDGSGNFALTGATDSLVAGVTEAITQDSSTGCSSATAAADSVILIDDVNQPFEMPVVTGTTITAASLKLLLGKTCDIAIAGSTTTTIQQANIGASTYDVIVIVGGNVDRNTVYVKLNSTKMKSSGVV